MQNGIFRISVNNFHPFTFHHHYFLYLFAHSRKSTSKDFSNYVVMQFPVKIVNSEKSNVSHTPCLWSEESKVG